MQIQDNRLSSLKAYFEKEIQKSDFAIEEYRGLFKSICKELLQLPEHAVLIASDIRLSESEILTGFQAIKDLRDNRPLQYVIGSTPFLGLDIRCDERALIPRPETEELVSWILERATSKAKILDIGTGTGCIALGLKSALPDSSVHALDFSSEALSLCQENSTALDLTLSLHEADILQPLELGLSFDIIVSNPPYVLPSEQEAMRKNVLDHEPHLALFTPDDDPLLFYRAIAAFGLAHFAQSGVLYFEGNEAYADETAQLLSTAGYTDVEIRQDSFGKPRMIKAVLIRSEP